MMKIWQKIVSFFRKPPKVLSHLPAYPSPLQVSTPGILKKFWDNPLGIWQLAAAMQSITILVLAGWLVYMYNYKGAVDINTQQLPSIPPVRVIAGHPEKGTFEQFTNIAGTLKATESVTLRPEVEGKVRDIYFTSGQRVKKGDKILKIEDAIYKANLEEAEAKLELGRSTYERALALLKRQAGTVKDKDKTYAEWQVTKAEVDKARSQLKKTLIVAPFDGILGLKNLSIGAYVKPGEEIVILSDMDPMNIEFSIAEQYLDKVQPGKDVTLEIDAFPDNVFRAQIESIDANVDPLNRSLKVRATFPNINDGELRPGLFGRIKLLISSHEDVLMVPDSAVETRGTREYVYLVKNGVAVATPVKVGGRNGKMVEIQSGLEPEDTVVFVGSMKLQDSMPVQVIPQKAMQAALGGS
jgi:membrane fusion protein (multidrug efflux system)